MGARSSHIAAMRGSPESSSATDSEKSTLPVPNVRLPLSLTNRLDQREPWNGNWNVDKGTSSELSSASGRTVPV